MPPNKLHKKCPRCGKGFFTYEADLIYCNSACEGKAKYEAHFEKVIKPKKTRECKQCYMTILSPRVFCDGICKKAYQKPNREAKTLASSHKDRKPNPNKLPYEVLNKIAEKKRLYDNFYIEKQIRGNIRNWI